MTQISPEQCTDCNSKVAFMFHLGHGHYTQFLNFQECCPTEFAQKAVWIGLDGMRSGNPLCKLPFLPSGIRYKWNRLWQMKNGLAQQPNLDAVFVAAEQLNFRPVLRKHRSYLYTDLTPSLKRELTPWYDHQLIQNPVLAQLRQYAWQQFYNSLKGVFTMSEWAAKGVRQDYGLSEKQVHVIHPGANLNHWNFVDRSDSSSSEPVRILMVGGQFRLKGGLMLLEWAEHTQAKNWHLDMVTWPGELPEWVVECLGNFGLDERVRRSLAPRLPNVTVHCGVKANTPEIKALFHRADIFCLPTQADGSSIASLEAMATGLPVVVGAVGGIPELIEDGVTGYLMKRSDAEDLAVKLERLITDKALRLKIGKTARQSCEDYYNVPRQMQELFTVLERDKYRERYPEASLAFSEKR